MMILRCGTWKGKIYVRVGKLEKGGIYETIMMLEKRGIYETQWCGMLDYLCSRWAIKSSIGPEARTSCWPVHECDDFCGDQRIILTKKESTIRTKREKRKFSILLVHSETKEKKKIVSQHKCQPTWKDSSSNLPVIPMSLQPKHYW